jgi:hypothetical protein
MILDKCQLLQAIWSSLAQKIAFRVIAVAYGQKADSSTVQSMFRAIEDRYGSNIQAKGVTAYADLPKMVMLTVAP